MEVKLLSNILKANDLLADANRRTFGARGVMVLNLLSSPGSGKTTLLERTAAGLAGRLGMAVIEGDLFTTRDAERIERQGLPVVQINTQGGCHLDAGMVSSALSDLKLEGKDLLFIENVGNLVCPAGYDLGEDLRVVVLSVAEGNDKPAKYPAAFRGSQAVVLNKTDLLPYTDFDVEEFLADVRGINPALEVFPLSARTGQGTEAWFNWVEAQVKRRRRAV